MKTLGAFIVLLLCALAQAALARLVPPLRTVRVDVCLIVLVGFALRADEQRGLLLGVLAGLAVDVAGGGRLGVCALGYGAVGLVAGSLEESFFAKALGLYGVLVFVSVLLCSGVVYVVLSAYGPTHNILVELTRTLLPTAVATAVVAPFALVWMEERAHD